MRCHLHRTRSRSSPAQGPAMRFWFQKIRDTVYFLKLSFQVYAGLVTALSLCIILFAMAACVRKYIPGKCDPYQLLWQLPPLWNMIPMRSGDYPPWGKLGIYSHVDKCLCTCATEFEFCDSYMSQMAGEQFMYYTALHSVIQQCSNWAMTDVKCLNKALLTCLVLGRLVVTEAPFGLAVFSDWLHLSLSSSWLSIRQSACLRFCFLSGRLPCLPLIAPCGELWTSLSSCPTGWAVTGFWVAVLCVNALPDTSRAGGHLLPTWQ